MNSATLLELFGYLGSMLVIVSMLMTSVFRLRVINTIGSVLFAVYALLIHSYPTMIMNLFLAGINIWHITRLRGTSRHYDLVQVTPEEGFLQYLLSAYQEDLLHYFPTITPEQSPDCLAFVTCCENNPAGFFLARQASPSSMQRLEVILDYTTPFYRDCSAGTFLYQELRKRGVRELTVPSASDPHSLYLEKMGFTRQPDGGYHREL